MGNLNFIVIVVLVFITTPLIAMYFFNRLRKVPGHIDYLIQIESPLVFEKNYSKMQKKLMNRLKITLFLQILIVGLEIINVVIMNTPFSKIGIYMIISIGLFVVSSVIAFLRYQKFRNDPEFNQGLPNENIFIAISLIVNTVFHSLFYSRQNIEELFNGNSADMKILLWSTLILILTIILTENVLKNEIFIKFDQLIYTQSRINTFDYLPITDDDEKIDLFMKMLMIVEKMKLSNFVELLNLSENNENKTKSRKNIEKIVRRFLQTIEISPDRINIEGDYILVESNQNDEIENLTNDLDKNYEKWEKSGEKI